MKIKSSHLLGAALAALLVGCAATSLKQTWKAPDYHGGPPQKIAVIAVDDRGMVRQVMEGQYVTQLKALGQPAFAVQEILNLQEIKDNKDGAAAKLRAAGADAVMVIRLVDTETAVTEQHQASRSFSHADTGYAAFGWYDEYSVGFIGVLHNSLRQDVYIGTSLFTLQTEKCLWSGLTETVLKDNTDRLEIVRPLVTKVVTAMHKDGVIR
jgi:hypothetical protein